MAWGKNRERYERKGLRYPSDLTDEEWALIEPFLPVERSVCRRSLVNAILYLLTTGCQWRQLPKDFPPRSTVHDYLMAWRSDGVLAAIHHALYVTARELAGRNPTPTLALNTVYRVTLTGGAAAIRDAFGNALTTTSFSFRTRT